MSRRIRHGAVAAATVALALASLSACSTTSPAAEPDSTATGGENIVWVGFQDGDGLANAVSCGATAAATEAGANFELKTSKFTPAAQTPILQAAAANKPDGIILSPVHQTAMQGPADAIAASGTPIITSNQLLTDSSNLAGVTKVDNYGAGVLAADYFAEQADGKDVKVAIETFTEGASKSADDELNGFLDQLEKYPNLTNVGTEFGDLEVSTYISATSNLLAQHPDLFGVFTTFAAPANGALASIAQNKSDTIVVGGYASKDENLVNALKDGRMGAIVDFDWYQLGYQTTEQMLAAIRDGEPQPEQSLGAAITTVDNIDDLTKADAGC